MQAFDLIPHRLCFWLHYVLYWYIIQSI